ncbi:bifunctional 4-alpha-glucanotransferase/amylo-alpha-1,6-glucosidase [Dispira simplex]|nr:bifunctional 4-alpha-glucanotransferase/amylo-alpha-1,6-glucosidase [Dispira simplex]
MLNVYTLHLNERGEPGKQNEFIRLPSPSEAYGLRFKIIAGSEAAHDPVLYTNYPLMSEPFDRKRFNSRPFVKGAQTELWCDLMVSVPGPYQYYVEYLDDSQENAISRTPTAYFIVDPLLSIRSKPQGQGITQEAVVPPPVLVPLDGIVLQSVVPKWMGPLRNWHQHLESSAQLGYNMIHFVPPQQRGASDSPFSIRDQLALSDDLFTPQDRIKTNDDKYEVLSNLLLTMEAEWGMLGLVDMVWNHTSFDSDWLLDHPEAGYNLHNSPHLRPAFEVDEALMQLSSTLGRLGLPEEVHNEGDLDKLMEGVKTHALQNLKLWEFYTINVETCITQVEQVLRDPNCRVTPKYNPKEIRQLPLKEKVEMLTQVAFVQPQAGCRFGWILDVMELLAFMHALCGSLRDVEHVLQHVRQLLNELNVPRYDLYDQHMASIMTNIRNTVKYERLDGDGPKKGTITAENPIVPTYFTRLPLNERTRQHPEGSRFLANNGWVWNADALENFAEAPSSAYLERKVIVWSDCVKLRYGNAPEDNPWLWEHMRQYTQTMARYFHGFRIDNCHSTPLPLAEYLLDSARQIRPNLYVLAELFTGSEDVDRVFVNRMGINSLVREALRAWSSFELSRQVHRSGGKPIGSMDTDCLAEKSAFTGTDGKQVPCRSLPLVGSLPHAMFTECTHDNPTPTQQRTSEDTLPNAALVALACSASASVKGYDEIYPHLLELAHESRQYQILEDPLTVGIGRAKQVFQRLHLRLAVEGFNEVHVHHENQYIMVHRQHPVTREGYLVVAHTAFPGSQEESHLDPVKLRSTQAKALFSARLWVEKEKYREDSQWIKGLPSRLEDLEPARLTDKSDEQGRYTELTLPSGFGPGSVLLLHTWIPDVDLALEEKIRTGEDSAVDALGELALNTVLYRCEEEERDIKAENGVYNVPHHGSLPYCGLQGFMSVLNHIITHNDLGHPLCANLRAGTWALEYTVNRLIPYRDLLYPELDTLIQWYHQRFELIRKVPTFLRPKYFALAIYTMYKAATRRAILLSAGHTMNMADPFVQQLLLCKVQLLGAVKSTGLHPTAVGASLAAGLPHFATQHMRCWGRDVFISLPGFFIINTGHQFAREHILAFASVIRHGLIPNLLDAQRHPRYNSRDTPWWFLQAIQEYCNHASEGVAFLQTRITRRFPRDDMFVAVDDPRSFAETCTLAEIIQEILQRHVQGIHFREWNAGPQLDHAMRDEGFQIDITTDWDTGFVLGGNEFNCGTWMDKMGDSAKAKTLGRPATPRDGAAVEIIGLLKSTVRWLAALHDQGKFHYAGVKRTLEDGTETLVEYTTWNDLIQRSFERYFYITLDRTVEDPVGEPHPSLVNRRGIYKDTTRSTKQYTDYQLRPNFCVAMVVAPELFDRQHALHALLLVKEHLLGPLGLKTLDPADWAYRGIYDNTNDSDDATVAHGINYHQGPEWVWCTGFFLRAWLHFAKDDAGNLPPGLVHEFHRILLNHKQAIVTSPFAGLPELTNENGAFCSGSCPTQAWSAATLLSFLNDLAKV